MPMMPTHHKKAQTMSASSGFRLKSRVHIRGRRSTPRGKHDTEAVTYKKEMHDDHDNRAAAYCDEWDGLPGNIIDECGADGPPLHFGHEAALFNVTMRWAIRNRSATSDPSLSLSKD